MKILRSLKMKRTAVMVVAAVLMINTIIANLTVVVNAEENANIAVTEIDMGEYSDTMAVGEKQLLSVTVLPLNATNQTITYSSSNTSVATINGLGRITALSVGTTTITATCQGKSGSFTLTVKAQETNNNIAVTEIDMGEYSDTMAVGEKQLLSVTVLPTDASNQTITYSSSNTSVATINGLGRITAVSVGTTTITATCQEKSGSFTLTVKEKSESDIPVKEIDLGEYESEMEIGSSQLLSVTPLPTNATNTTVTYKSSDTSVATVNSMGRISALKIGKTTITIKCGGITSSIRISVVAKKDETIEVKDIEIANHEDEVKVDETISLSATVLPSDATDATVTYKSSNEKVATVNSSGEVKGISAGTVIITITAGKITKKEKIKVIVPTKAISMNSNYLVLKPGDSFTLSGTVAPSDAVQTLTYKSINTSVATVSSSGVVTAKAVGNTSIIVSNGDFQAAVSVIVNTSNDSTNNTDVAEESSQTSDQEINYENIISASENAKVDTDMLKYLYENKAALLIMGDGYSISLDGNNIVNYLNEFNTDIKLNKPAQSDSSKNIEGISFVINDGKPICGDITLYLDNISGKYLYLYNESKEQYELISSSDLSEINISTPGKYIITDSKIRNGNWIILIIIIVGGVVLIVGIGVYIGLKKQYWFW